MYMIAYMMFLMVTIAVFMPMMVRMMFTFLIMLMLIVAIFLRPLFWLRPLSSGCPAVAHAVNYNEIHHAPWHAEA